MTKELSESIALAIGSPVPFVRVAKVKLRAADGRILSARGGVHCGIKDSLRHEQDFATLLEARISALAHTYRYIYKDLKALSRQVRDLARVCDPTLRLAPARLMYELLAPSGLIRSHSGYLLPEL